MKSHYLKLLLVEPLMHIEEPRFKQIVLQATKLVTQQAYKNLLRSSYQHTLQYLEQLEKSQADESASGK